MSCFSKLITEISCQERRHEIAITINWFNKTIIADSSLLHEFVQSLIYSRYGNGYQILRCSNLHSNLPRILMTRQVTLRL